MVGKLLTMVTKNTKILALFLLPVFLLAVHFCAIEDALASSGHPEKTQPVHSNEARQFGDSVKGGHHNDTSSDGQNHEKTSCCSDLVAIQTNSNVVLQKPDLENLFTTLKFSLSILSTSTYSTVGKRNLIDFSPEKSPPAVFLLSHFTHAPPASL